MKIHYKNIPLILIWILTSCNIDNIKLYNDADYIQFSKYLIDSLSCSFLGYPNDNEIRFPIEVEVVGAPMDRDREYKILLMKDFTDATEKNYKLPEKTIIRAGRVVDTCWIQAYKTDEISRKSVKLTIRLEETDDFKTGQTDKIAAIIHITNVIQKPDWWNASVTSSYLGEYSDKKYRLFIQETGMVDIDSSDNYELHYYTLILKNYLSQEKDAGRTVYEEDGREMTVNMVRG